MIFTPKDVVVIIRSAGERTTEACYHLVSKQVPAHSVEIIQERPFELALKKTYQIGMQRQTRWTITLDADMLLRDGAIESYVLEADKMPKHAILLIGMLYDKLIGIYRQGGVRVYRTALLDEALKHIPQVHTQERPEAYILNSMEAIGYPPIRNHLICGIHDYEQYYRDIYRKTFVYASKHPEFYAQMLSRWKALSDKDADFLVALKGLSDGIMSREIPKIDIGAYPKTLFPILEQFELKEKTDLVLNSLSVDYVEKVLMQVPPYLKQNRLNYKWLRMKDHFSKLGPLRMFPFFIGSLLQHSGQFFKTLAAMGLSKDN